jgi:hypothetical protein
LAKPLSSYPHLLTDTSHLPLLLLSPNVEDLPEARNILMQINADRCVSEIFRELPTA